MVSFSFLDTSVFFGSPMISPFSQRLFVTHEFPFENCTIVLWQWLVQNGQGAFASCVYENVSRFVRSHAFTLSGSFSYCSLAISPTPIAPMIPGYGALTTSRPTYSSIARKTASFSKVPPCTTIFFPKESRFDTRITFVNTF